MKLYMVTIVFALCFLSACENKPKDAPKAEQATEPAIQEGTKGLKSAKKAAGEIENKAADRMKAADEAAGQ